VLAAQHESALKEKLGAAGLTVERASYTNITFFAPILFGRLVMRVTGLRPASENNINIGDPWYGNSVQDYGSMPSSYHGGGSWTHTYTTKS
jgi:hypothetical protein